MPACNCCLRKVQPNDNPGNGLCGPCHRLETPESDPSMLEGEEF